MKINSITNQSFEANKFRIPVKKVQTKWGDIPVDCVKEFDNPKARELYERAQKTENIEERINLLSQMGDYRIIDNSAEKSVNRFLNSKLP